MTIKLIACVSSDGGLGKDNDLLFHIKEDMKHFRELTKNQLCVQGRYTFESILSMNGKPLPNRVNVVLSTNKDYKVPSGVFLFDSVDKIIKHHRLFGEKDKDICVIGGSEPYRLFLPHAHEVHLTIVNRHIEGTDTYFPMNELHSMFTVAEESEEFYSEEYDAYYKFTRYVKNTSLKGGDGIEEKANT